MRVRGAKLLAVLNTILAAQLCGCSPGGHKPVMQANEQTIPIVRLSLGDDFRTIQAQSTYRFPARPLQKVDIIAASEPVILHYNRTGCEFALPAARSFGAAVDNGHAVSVTISPQLSYLPLADALKLADVIRGGLTQSQWHLAKQYRTVAEVQRSFEDPKQDSSLTIRTDLWRCGDDEIAIQIERQWKKGESLPQQAGKDFDFMVVTVKIDNDKVRAQYPGY